MLPDQLDKIIKEMLWDGTAAVTVARFINISPNIVYNVKSGRRGFAVPWPDGSTGAMPLSREAIVSKQQKGRGRYKELQQAYNLVEQVNTDAIPTVIITELSAAYDEYTERMAHCLREYRSRHALANGYHEEIKPLLDERARLLESLDGAHPESVDKFKKLSEELDTMVTNLLEGIG